MAGTWLIGVAVGLCAGGCLSKPGFDGGDGPDEDGDGVPNVTDPCPHRDDADGDRDDDGDGVGDGCDPEPGVVNLRVLFEGFDTAECGTGDLVLCTAGTIDQANGWYGFSQSTSGAALFAADRDRYAVTIGFDVTGRDQAAQYNEVGLMLVAEPPATDDVQGIQAILGRTADMEYLQLYLSTDAQDDVLAHQEVTTLDLDMPLDDAVIECEVRLPAINCALRHAQLMTTFSSAMITRGPGQIGLLGNYIDARIRYVFVVSLAS